MIGFQFANRCSRSLDVCSAALGAAEACELFDRPHLALLDVGAAAECPAGAAEDPDLCVVVVVELEQRLSQLLDDVVVQCIRALRVD